MDPSHSPLRMECNQEKEEGGNEAKQAEAMKFVKSEQQYNEKTNTSQVITTTKPQHIKQ